ncbi:hypothetical protein BS162P1_00037 [Bacteroides phage BS162P1]|jgi:hypothetical protein|nr:hypothetical protein BS162P1_00037 [Bacteroides phage BS162P1]
MIMSSFSQSTYPKIILNEGDTVVAVTPNQLVRINRDLNSFNYLQKSYLNIVNQLSVADSLNTVQKQMLSTQDEILAVESLKFERVMLVNDNLRTTFKKEKKETRNKALLIGGGVGLSIGFIVGVIIK